MDGPKRLIGSSTGSVLADAQGLTEVTGNESEVRESSMSAAMESMSDMGSRLSATRNVRVIFVELEGH